VIPLSAKTSKRKMAEVLLWLIFTASFFAWVCDFLALVISSGSPHFEGSGWAQARIDNYEHTVHIATVLFYTLPILFFMSVLGLYILQRRVVRA